MWLCAKCREKIEDGFDVCWNCGTSREGAEDPQFSPEPVAELFVHKEKFDVYCCPRCGRVEFFVDGIGEQFRPH